MRRWISDLMIKHRHRSLADTVETVCSIVAVAAGVIVILWWLTYHIRDF